MQIDDADDGEELPDPSLWKLIAASAPEWYLILIGVITSAVDGAAYPVTAIFVGHITKVFIINRVIIKAQFYIRHFLIQLWLRKK